MTEKEINELKERVNRITGLMNQIKAEMDSNIVSVSISTLSSGSSIHIQGKYDPRLDIWDYDFFREMFSDYQESEFSEINTELHTSIDGVRVFTLADKDVNND